MKAAVLYEPNTPLVIENVSLTLSLRRELAASGGSPEGILQAMRQLAENPR